MSQKVAGRGSAEASTQGTGSKWIPQASCSRVIPALASTTPASAPPTRRPRRDRDRELVRYVGRHGLVRIAHVMAAMEAGRTVTYNRVAVCVEAGLLERLELVRSEQGLLRATRDGLSFAGLGLSVAKVSPGGVDHLLRCATTAQLLESNYADARVLSERELVLAEQIAGRPIASAEVGRRRGITRLHRPDLAVVREGVAPIAVEVELTPKAPGRLQEIMRAWRFAVGRGTVSEVHYLCEPGQARAAVDRAVAKVHAGEFVQIGKAVAR